VIPTLNEIVYIILGPSPKYPENKSNIAYYFPPIGVQSDSNNNQLANSVVSKKEMWSSTSGEGEDKNNTHINVGKRLELIPEIRPLIREEGDVILEGRFGQFIKFGSDTDYHNPITLIRNGQSKEGGGDNFEHIKEDINNDNSSIYLYSKDAVNISVASFNDSSYLTDIFEEITADEPFIANTEITTNKEDIVMSSADDVIPEELQENELSNITDSDKVYYDISPTEDIVSLKDGSATKEFNNNYNLNIIDINEKLV